MFYRVQVQKKVVAALGLSTLLQCFWSTGSRHHWILMLVVWKNYVPKMVSYSVYS